MNKIVAKVTSPKGTMTLVYNTRVNIQVNKVNREVNFGNNLVTVR